VLQGHLILMTKLDPWSSCSHWKGLVFAVQHRATSRNRVATSLYLGRVSRAVTASSDNSLVIERPAGHRHQPVVRVLSRGRDSCCWLSCNRILDGWEDGLGTQDLSNTWVSDIC
jgi:hypothetical protein